MIEIAAHPAQVASPETVQDGLVSGEIKDKSLHGIGATIRSFAASRSRHVGESEFFNFDDLELGDEGAEVADANDRHVYNDTIIQGDKFDNPNNREN